jgi:hypothetical protein
MTFETESGQPNDYREAGLRVGLVNMGSLRDRHSQPKSAAKTGKVGHVGHWRAFLTTTPRTTWRGAAGPSHFPLTISSANAAKTVINPNITLRGGRY